MAGEIDLKVSADIGDLRRQLESIPGITAEQARLMVAELDRGYKRAEKAAASAAKATRAAMMDPDNYASTEKMKALQQKEVDLKAQLAEAYAQWENWQ